MVYMGKERACSVPCVHITDRLDGFAEIKAPDCPAVIWQRALDPAVQNWLDQLSTAHLPKARVIIRPDDIRPTVEEVCDASGTPGLPAKTEVDRGCGWPCGHLCCADICAIPASPLGCGDNKCL